MGETRVDLLHLLEDLRDAYPGPLEETILTEIVANSLDSGATLVVAHTDATAGTLTVTDNGKGMSRQALSRYHDLAATSKRRGQSIGFAGVGIKLGLLISEQVVTETRRARTHLATSWHLSSRSRAPWRWTEPPGLQTAQGTTVRLYLRNTLSELLEPGFVENTLIHHFAALLDPAFDEILAPSYPAGIRFEVNGRPVARAVPTPGRVPIGVRVGRQRKPSGVGYLVRDPELPESERGIGISTLGKVIKRGWDWLGLTPAGAEHVTGLIEIPALVETLTLNKADFVRSGAKGATYLAYRKALQEVVAGQLEQWGETPQPASAPPRKTRALERDLQSVLGALTDDYPILATLVERRRGGQQKLPFGGEGSRVIGTPEVAVGVGSAIGPAAEGAAPPPDPHLDGGQAAGAEAERADATPAPVAAVDTGGSRAPKQAARLGLTIRFESRPGEDDLGALRESTLWVNDAHPAYRRAVASRSEGYHVALTVAMTLARLAVEPQGVHDFVAAFLASWGSVGKNGRGHPR